MTILIKSPISGRTCPMVFDETETFAKRPLLPNLCVHDERDLSTGSNFNPQNTKCMDACPDKLFIGVVKIFACLELEQN